VRLWGDVLPLRLKSLPNPNRIDLPCITANLHAFAVASSASRSSATIASGYTLRGNGALGDGSIPQVTNQGTVIADKGQLMTYGAFDNTAGLSGGTIQGLGANSQLLSGGGRYKNLTLSGTLAVTQGNRIDTEGTLTNTGTLTLTGGAGPSMNLLADTTLVGPGTTVLNNASLYGSPATLTVGAGQTLRGGGNLYLGGVNNQGTYENAYVNMPPFGLAQAGTTHRASRAAREGSS